ncbi:MAG: zinc ribbon domain-containing protein [Gammaproteobacteria bacterium]|nr:zinc ribbon domain-containing protein [Gammaproteobacteria bacterium]
MPRYDYFCEANARTVEVRHPMHVQLGFWGQVCYAAQIPLGDTDPLAPVRKVLTPPYVNVPTSDSTLKEKGFTKLVRRDHGVYENVTAIDGESRYMRAGDTSTVPQIHKKVGD